MLPSRGRIKVNGRWKQVGSYTIDLRTKTVGRLFKSTGVFPETKNALDLVREIKLMVKDLDVQRDERKLGQIKLGKVRLLDALAAYKAGRLNFAEAHAGESLRKSLAHWLKGVSASEYTTKQFAHYLKRLDKLELVRDETTVREIPDIVRRLRVKFSREGKAVYFRSLRQMFISYLKNHLGYDDDSVILKQILRTPLIKARFRREHHPIRSVHDLVDLGKRINTAGRWNRREVDYKSWVYFMSFTGLRPTEFAKGLWERDQETGHLRVNGTKTLNAKRVIPNVMWLNPESRSLTNLQMRLINLDPPTPVRSRDFRRTAAIWYEQAGVPRSRYSYYLGHGAKDVTGLYEKRTPTKEELDEDKRTLLNWIERQRTTARPKKARVWSPRSATFIADFEAIVPSAE